jgi:ABC-type branched-subunit amino acid transport system ATPase component
MNEPVLVVRDLSVTYGGVTALNGVCLEVPAESLIGLIGPNGAGKTTLIDAVSGFCASQGAIFLDGQPLMTLRAHHRARLGLARTFQAGELYDDMIVIENVMLGSFRGGLRSALREIVTCHAPKVSAQVRSVMTLLGLDDQADQLANELSVGTRKLVTIARALAAEPRIVLLDEPAAGLDTTESARLGSILQQLPEAGVAVLLVDHDIDLVIESCDVVHVLDMGTTVASGHGRELRDQPAVVEAYLGGAATAP